MVGKASAPSGTSVGNYEANFMPKPIDRLIIEAKKILLPKIMGMEASSQENFDYVLRELDGTRSYSRIGGCVSIALSMAYAHACSKARGLPLYSGMKKGKKYSLPYPLGKCIGGGAHAKRSTSIQEFLAIPVGAGTLHEAIQANRKMHEIVYTALKDNFPTFKKGLDLEGGWIADITDEDALGIMTGAAVHAAAETGVRMRIGIDIAANNIYRNGKYHYGMESKSPERQLDYVLDLIDEYNLFYVEDAFREDDWESFAELTSQAKDCLVCGDDLFATSTERLETGINKKACNAIIIKPNQAGTLTQTYDTIRLAKKKNYVPVVSHRSGETGDTTIAHLAVAFSCPIIKIGIVGKEREAKLNELLRIEKQEKLKMNGEING
jgi:enolase